MSGPIHLSAGCKRIISIVTLWLYGFFACGGFVLFLGPDRMDEAHVVFMVMGAVFSTVFVALVIQDDAI